MLLQTDVFFFFRIIGMVHLLLQPVAMPDSRENMLLLKKRQLSEINENTWKATPASFLFERHFSFGSFCKHKREELLCLAPQRFLPLSFCWRKTRVSTSEFPVCAAFYLMHLRLWREVQCLGWHSSLLCFWPHRGGGTRTKWVNPELGGLCWKGTTGKKVHLSFITFCLKHMGGIRSYIFILMSWDFEACLEIYARPSVWSETVLWCACTSSIFLWFSPPVIY